MAFQLKCERVAELEAERTGTIHESWQHKTHAEVLEGLKWQGAITKSLLAANDELQVRLAEAERLLVEMRDDEHDRVSPGFKQTIASFLKLTDSADEVQK